MSILQEWPDQAEGRRLHAALCRGSPTAPRAFADAFYTPLCHYLSRVYPQKSEDAITDVAGNLIVALIKAPTGYDPDKLPVCRFLRMAAKRKLSTAREREARRRRREVSLASVADPATGRNKWSQADDGLSWADPSLAAEIAAFDPDERAVFELMRAGERRTAAYAAALGIDSADPDTPLVVKRMKDTIKARLRRAVGGR